MSNLTSASSEISASSGIRNDNGFFHAHQYSSTSINQEPQPKKKRSLPGHPGHTLIHTIFFSLSNSLQPKSVFDVYTFICQNMIFNIITS